MDLIVDKRLEMVHMAREIGLKPTARFYKTDRNTVRKWCRRYTLEGLDGLKDKSKKPRTSPTMMKKSDQNKIKEVSLAAKEKKKYITVKNVRKKTKIKRYSDVTINRYIKKSLGKEKNKVHPKTNGGSLEFKKHLKPFEIIQIDIKYLTDIDNLKPYFIDNNLAKYQITARDVVSGFSIVSYCDEKSVIYTKMFLEEVLFPFLKQFKHLNLKEIIIQTDNGSEFTNRYIKTFDGHEAKDTIFTIYINNQFKKHRTNIPGHCTANSEVESFHWDIERDCLAWEDIIDNKSLLRHVEEYINVYNHTIIKRRGYSPYGKIKETLKAHTFKVPKPRLLSHKNKHK